MVVHTYPRLNRDWLIAGAIYTTSEKSRSWELHGVLDSPREGNR